MTALETKLKIMDRIAKLLAQAEGTTHEAEANSAKAMAAKLMAKHQISELEAKEDQPFTENCVPLTRKNHVQYNCTLHQALANYCGVAYLSRTNAYSVASHVYVGKSQDLEALDYILDVVLGQRKREYAAWRKEFKNIYGRAPKDKEWTKWNFGFAFGLRDKLEELKRMENDAVVEYGLVPVDMADQAMAHYKKDNDVKTTNRKHKFNEDGYIAGQKTSINKGIESDHGPTLKIGG